jgi:hypothetical protein
MGLVHDEDGVLAMTLQGRRELQQRCCWFLLYILGDRLRERPEPSEIGERCRKGPRPAAGPLDHPACSSSRIPPAGNSQSILSIPMNDTSSASDQSYRCSVSLGDVPSGRLPIAEVTQLSLATVQQII